ncbi:alpha/beta fold hydrolase [Rubrivivax gelatinosus]|uniref:alpha/beta fold hydrolase n=1 Tax=Rubrivivax gelatinosus TaxID=28068 RepID=UPI0003198E65|nr:alpha/beta hydrolase [Rubrivivax gelatinosus]MBG6082506.1 sigma-B regulation protein RsbQ [Rubrivivax gelatinosus]
MDLRRRHHVTFAGRDDAARSLVFAHGFGTDQRAWAQIWPAFADEFRIVLYDHAGAGQADPAAFEQHRYLTMDGYARDLNALLDELALKDVVLIGHSMGAMTGILAAIARPEHFSRLVGIGASARYLDDPDYHGGFSEADLNALYRSVTIGRDAWAEQFAPLAMANRDRPELAEHFANTIKSVPTHAILTVLCSIFQCDYRQTVRQLTHPLLLLQTRDDAAVPLAAAEFLHQAIAGSTLRVIDAEGHLPHMSAPDRVLEALQDFVRAPG